MNWSEDLKKDIYLYRFSDLVLQEYAQGVKKQPTKRTSINEESLEAFCKALLNSDTMKMNS